MTTYYNASGGAYTNEDYSFWQDSTGQWYRGDKAKNIVAVTTPAWAQSSGLGSLMPIIGAAAGYYLGGKSIIAALAGFGVGLYMTGD